MRTRVVPTTEIPMVAAKRFPTTGDQGVSAETNHSIPPNAPTRRNCTLLAHPTIRRRTGEIVIPVFRARSIIITTSPAKGIIAQPNSPSAE